MSCLTEKEELQNMIKALENDVRYYTNEITLDQEYLTEASAKLEEANKKLKQLDEVKKFYIGSILRAVDNIDYLLVKVNGEMVRLVNLRTGIDKAGQLQFEKIELHYDASSEYVTKLPTNFPKDFGLDSKCGAMCLNYC